ncbi:hypothetical protein [Nocardioides bizhenqiangii]|uniref:Uncharacterized protein n=1 Tax=Nocardioides bizhenqiangii TaxID=3095076 RepID=A0ABZ0ZXB8_9ACTN|nr:hypothetical protein [Nocardioides sp. HM61]WQQ28292.1 hypothetical protein SHK19_08670 [Nocardioides sp. HM61]
MDDAEERTRSVIAQAFDRYRQYHETLAPDELERVEMLGRLGREVASELGGEVSSAAVPQRDGLVRVCLWYAAAAPLPEPA